jgi:hypothetical protein
MSTIPCFPRERFRVLGLLSPKAFSLRKSMHASLAASPERAYHGGYY